MLCAGDLFAGAGGTSHGAERSGAARLCVAVNHWPTAIQTHAANFPHAQHFNARVGDVRPTEYNGRLDVIFASPECVHHSNARGGQPMEDQRRSGADDLMPWLHAHSPEWFVVENVREFASWGPLDGGATGRPIKERRGEYFERWLRDLQAAGYTVEYNLLNAADFGAHTSRTRLFVIGRRRGRKRKAVIRWPEPTHHKRGLNGLPMWRPAYEVIDWSLECPSIFTRKRQLAANTLRRIGIGLRRFCAPYMVQWDQQSGGPHVREVTDPTYSMTTKANTGVAVPYGINNKGRSDAFDLCGPDPTMTAHARHLGLTIPFQCAHQRHNAGRGVGEPVGTILAGGTHHGIAVPFQFQLIGRGAGRSRDTAEPVPTIIAARENHGLVVPFLQDANHGATSGTRTHTPDAPLGTLTTKRNQCLIVPVLTQYYGTGHADSVGEPVATITTKSRHALATYRFGADGPSWADIDMADSAAMASLLSAMCDFHVCDVGYRMLVNYELALAQGFAPGYSFCGNTTDITKQIGNSVSPCVAQAITTALAS